MANKERSSFSLEFVEIEKICRARQENASYAHGCVAAAELGDFCCDRLFNHSNEPEEPAPRRRLPTIKIASYLDAICLSK